MKKFIKQLFTLEKNPKKGLMAYEWVVLAYLAATLIMTVAMHSRLPNAGAMLMGRLQILAVTFARASAFPMATKISASGPKPLISSPLPTTR